MGDAVVSILTCRDRSKIESNPSRYRFKPLLLQVFSIPHAHRSYRNIPPVKTFEYIFQMGHGSLTGPYYVVQRSKRNAIPL